MGDSLMERKNRTMCEIAKNHIEQLTKSQNEMRKARLNCDCTLEVTWYGGEVSSQINYAVVSAASKYCRRNSKCKYGKWTVEVDLRDCLMRNWRIVFLFGTNLVKEALEQCIEFMYIGKADIRDDTVVCITILSHILQLKPLEGIGLKTMHGNLTTCDNCYRLLRVAGYCKRREYKADAIRKWISLNLQQMPGLNECSPENLWRSAADLFQNLPVFTYQCNMLDVLKLIELEKSDCKFLLDVVITNKKVPINSAATKYVFETICQKINREPLNLNCGNYYKVKNLLAKYGSNDTSGLKVTLEKFMISNFDVLAEQDGFLETNQDEVTSILSSPQLTCTEKTKFDFMVKWVKHKPEDRADTFPELFKLIKLQNLCEKKLINIGKILLAENQSALISPVFDELENKQKSLQVNRDTAKWVMDQRPEVDNSSNASEKSGTSTCIADSSNTISNFSTASLEEDLLSLMTSDSGAEVDVSIE